MEMLEILEIFLIVGIKNGNSGLKMLSPIIVHNDDNSYTDDIRKLFNGERV